MAKVLTTKQIIDMQWAIERIIENHCKPVPFQADNWIESISTSDMKLTFHIPRMVQAISFPDLVRLLIREGYERNLYEMFPTEESFRQFLMDCGFHCIEGVDPQGRSWPVIAHISVGSTMGVR